LHSATDKAGKRLQDADIPKHVEVRLIAIDNSNPKRPLSGRSCIARNHSTVGCVHLASERGNTKGLEVALMGQ